MKNNLFYYRRLGNNIYGNENKNAGTNNNNAGSNAVRQVTLANNKGTRNYSYDFNGNLTGDGTRSYVYNAFNKPTAITTYANQRLNPYDTQLSVLSTSDFYYGADQLRYKQVKNVSGVSTTTIYIDKLYEIISTGSSVETKSYIDDIAVMTKTNTGASTTHYIHRDRLGSMIASMDASGNLIKSHSYDPFGKPRDGRTNIARHILNSDTTNRGFTDHEHIDDAQIIHMNGRVYDYNLGRFMSVDPFIQDPGNSQSMNPYSYIMNNPLGGTDPSGYIAIGTANEKPTPEVPEEEVEEPSVCETRGCQLRKDSKKRKGRNERAKDNGNSSTNGGGGSADILTLGGVTAIAAGKKLSTKAMIKGGAALLGGGVVIMVIDALSSTEMGNGELTNEMKAGLLFDQLEASSTDANSSEQKLFLFRMGGGKPKNLKLSRTERGGMPPGKSLVIGTDAQSAASHFRAATGRVDHSVIGQISLSSVREAGFNVISKPTRRLPNHVRLIHPSGVAGFNLVNRQRLSSHFTNIPIL